MAMNRLGIFERMEMHKPVNNLVDDLDADELKLFKQVNTQYTRCTVHFNVLNFLKFIEPSRTSIVESLHFNCKFFHHYRIPDRYCDGESYIYEKNTDGRDSTIINPRSFKKVFS